MKHKHFPDFPSLENPSNDKFQQWNVFNTYAFLSQCPRWKLDHRFYPHLKMKRINNLINFFINLYAKKKSPRRFFDRPLSSNTSASTLMKFSSTTADDASLPWTLSAKWETTRTRGANWVEQQQHNTSCHTTCEHGEEGRGGRCPPSPSPCAVVIKRPTFSFQDSQSINNPTRDRRPDSRWKTRNPAVTNND